MRGELRQIRLNTLHRRRTLEAARSSRTRPISTTWARRCASSLIMGAAHSGVTGRSAGVKVGGVLLLAHRAPPGRCGAQRGHGTERVRSSSAQSTRALTGSPGRASHSPHSAGTAERPPVRSAEDG